MNVDAGAALLQAHQVLVDDAGRQAEGGNTPGHHAAGPVGHLIDIDLEAGDRQVMGGDQAGGAGTDDGNALVAGDVCHLGLEAVAQLFHDEALEIADLQGPVARRAAARRLAGRVADPAADRAERVGRGDRLEGLGEAAFPDIGDVGRRVGAHRAGDLTRRRDEVEIGGVVGELVLEGGQIGHLSRPPRGPGRGIPGHRAVW